jgi:extracellular elastinolytic metalloproteinase
VSTDCATFDTPADIPDDDVGGTNAVFDISDSGTIADLDICINVTHGWVGDLVMTLRHENTGTEVTLVDRPGVPATEFGCSTADFFAVLDDEAGGQSVENQCAGSPPAIGGVFRPSPEMLDAFDGENINGEWTLTVADVELLVVGQLLGSILYYQTAP